MCACQRKPLINQRTHVYSPPVVTDVRDIRPTEQWSCCVNPYGDVMIKRYVPEIAQLIRLPPTDAPLTDTLRGPLGHQLQRPS